MARRQLKPKYPAGYRARRARRDLPCPKRGVQALVIACNYPQAALERIHELTSALAEMVNLHSGEDYRAGRGPVCPTCERNVAILRKGLDAKEPLVLHGFGKKVR